MGLVTVFFHKPGGYRKAIIDTTDLDFFIKLGARSEPDFDPPIQRTEEPPTVIDSQELDPDKGHGAPGSYRFHSQQILSMESIEKISDYIKEVTGQELKDSIKTLKGAKLSALHAIRELTTDDS